MKNMLCALALAIAGVVVWVGCAERPPQPEAIPLMGEVPDTRTPIQLPTEADRAHREIMMQHLETVQVLTGALADGDYELAKGVTEAHIGFFSRRHVAIRQKMESIPPEYRALAGAHVQSAKELAASMPSKDLKQILPRFNAMLKTCMACHLEFRSEGTHSR